MTWRVISVTGRPLASSSGGVAGFQPADRRNRLSHQEASTGQHGSGLSRKWPSSGAAFEPADRRQKTIVCPTYTYHLSERLFQIRNNVFGGLDAH